MAYCVLLQVKLATVSWSSRKTRFQRLAQAGMGIGDDHGQTVHAALHERLQER